VSGESKEAAPAPAGGEIPEHWAHRLDPDLAAEREGRAPSASSGPPPSARPPGASRYGWFVGIVAILVLAWISLNTLENGQHGAGLRAGDPLPPFAVPLALSGLDADANLAARAGNGIRHAACDVHERGVLNLCALAGDSPLVLVFFSERDTASVRQVDSAQRVSARFPDVRFAAIAEASDRKKTRALIRRRRWTIPVGYDRHGDVIAAYFGSAVPELIFARPGRIAAKSLSPAKPLGDGRLTAEVQAIRTKPPRTSPGAP
jgi:hypothetical protein